MTHPGNPSAPVSSTREQRRVVAATTIGTAIEWYDYFLYAAAAGLVFNKLMFSPLGTGGATIVSFLTVGLSFLFRPLGAFLAGHFGDRYGRRAVLMVTLFAMGGATALIGLLPTYESIGILAPILLILLRIIQGISAGGEWGGAVLLAVEHAPKGKRGLFGAGPQVGVPMGLLMSSGLLALMNVIAPGDAFLEWGWRVPFLLSIVLVFIGYFIRVGVDESPVFEEIAQRKETTANPVGTLFKRYTPLVIVAALLFAGQNTVGYMTTGGYIQNYTTNPEGLAMERGDVLLSVTFSAVIWGISTLFAGWVCDYWGRRNTYIVGYLILGIGAAALFPLINTGSLPILYLALSLLSVGLGLTYGQQAAAYAEIFPASIRFSGVSVTYALGSIFGGAFAPSISAALVEATGTTTSVTIYLLIMVTVGLTAALLLRDRTDIPLGPDHEEEQASGQFQFSR
ncbi:MHS family MFS transporter [Corynebacterium testudinoris]|uniref:MFS transporter n=1 Tax=Corynebacterium testudinoris TaxID=136857 RepID=UPI001C8BF549|nr:MFS transporter [Corynebacterium testudinoris]MBX8996073.1 MHS family MFS transporter [Corynebacterium testudinoris]